MTYYLLTGINSHTNKHEVVFGDPDLQVVADEQVSTHDYKRIKMHTLKHGDQRSIDILVNRLNKTVDMI